MSGAEAKRSFQCVFIPADASQPLQEWRVEYDTATEVSCLIDRLKKHFTGGSMSPADREKLRSAVRAQITEQLKKQGGAAADKPVDDSLVDTVLSMSAVDCVPLQNNKKSTNYIGLMMYVDDQGKAKELPLNARASAVTQEVGIPTAVLGDALIARNFDDENSFRRIDFTLAELQDSQAQWRADAKRANAERVSGASEDKMQELRSMLAQAGVNKGTAAAAPKEKACSFAGCYADGSMRCSRCKRSWYCSQACQKKDWKFHKANVCLPAPTKTASAEAGTDSTSAAAAPADSAAAAPAEAAAEEQKPASTAEEAK